MTEPTVPALFDRIDRLEQAVTGLLAYVTDNQVIRVTRSVAAGASGSVLLDFFNAIAAEQAARTPDDDPLGDLGRALDARLCRRIDELDAEDEGR
jgi:hypothetical protein